MSMSTIPRPRFAAPALLYLLISLACTRVPLLQSLGYELCALTAFFSSIVSGLLTARYLSVNAVSENRLWIPVLFGRALAANLLLLLIPLTVMTVNALFVRNCSLPDGLVFFLLLPVVSVWFSSCLAAFCALHYRHPRGIFLGLVFLSLLYVLALGYWTPAIFSYNFFYGFFPGITYDEGLKPDTTLLLFRVMTFLCGMVFLWMALLLAGTTRAEDSVVEKGKALVRNLLVPSRRPIVAVVVGASALIFFYRGPLGFESSAGFVRERLGAVYETPHVTIFYAPESFSPDEIRRIGAEHEFRLHQIMQVFHMPTQGRIFSYIYPSAEVKKRLIGAGGTNIAKPWIGEVHLDIHSLGAALKHELVHVAAAPFGVPVIGASMSTGLVEGLAMAVEWDWGNRTLHQYAAGLRKFGLTTDIRGLMSLAGFASQGSSVSYVLAGSFCRFLMDRYGIRNLTRVYRTGDFRAVYDRDLGELITEWENFLNTVPVAESERDGIDALFRRPPIFQKECARVIGARNLEASMLFSGKAYRDAARMYGRSYAETGGYEALSGYVASALLAGDFGPLLAIRDTVIRHDAHPARYMPLFVHLGLAAWCLGDTAGALELFTRVERADVLEDRTEAALVCRFALDDTVNRDALLRYFLSGATDSLRVVALDSMVQDPQRHWLPLYLKGRALARMDRPEEAQRCLEMLDLQETSGYLEALRLRAIGALLFRRDRFEEAKAAFWTSLNHRSGEVWRLRTEEWIDRCEWSTLKNDD